MEKEQSGGLSPGATASIGIISSLLGAGGSGIAGYLNSKAQEEATAWDKKKWLADQQRLDQQRLTEGTRYQEGAVDRRVNSIQGISNLSSSLQKMKPLDYLSLLAGV